MSRKQVHGIIMGFDIWRDLDKPGNSFYLDLGQTCGTVYFPNVRTLRKMTNEAGRILHGSDSGLCARCGTYTGNTNIQGNACEIWISDLLKGEDAMGNKFIPLQQPGNVYGAKSYVAKIVLDGDKFVRTFLPLKKSFYRSNKVCELLIAPADCKLEKGDFLAVKLLYGKAAAGSYKDEKGEDKKIKERYYVLEGVPTEVNEFFDCLKSVKRADVIDGLTK